MSPHTTRWANGLVDRGHDVTVISGDESPLSSEPYRQDVVHEVLGTIPRLSRPWMEVGARLSARSLGRRLNPDIVHGMYLLWHGWTAHDLAVQPLVLSALGSDVLQLDERSDLYGRARLVQRYCLHRTRAAISAASIVLCDSGDLARRLEAHVPGVPTGIVRFGAEPPKERASARSAWESRLALSPDAFVVLSSRIFQRLYNINVIVEAFAKLRERVPHAVLVIKELEERTDPEYKRECLDRVGHFGMREAVRLVGTLPRDDLLLLTAAADAYVSVPDEDGTATSVLEAMAAGVPVVASVVEGIDTTLLRPKDTALLVPVGDPSAVADALEELVRDPASAERIAQRAAGIARRCDFDTELDRAVLLYEQLLHLGQPHEP
jgi:glycosyltransferase involved in cell wall biosynthesis